MFRVVRGGLLYRVSKRGTVEGLDLQTGERKWEFVVDPKIGVSCPVIVYGMLLFHGKDGCLYAFE